MLYIVHTGADDCGGKFSLHVINMAFI